MTNVYDSIERDSRQKPTHAGGFLGPISRIKVDVHLTISEILGYHLSKEEVQWLHQ